MPYLRNRFVRLVASLLFFTVLTSCGDVHSSRTSMAPHRVRVMPRNRSEVMVTTTTVDPDVATLNQARILIAEAVQAQGKSRVQEDKRSTRVPPATASVLACIRAHESGDYTEHSHLSDGSGAYQMIPSTWRTWAARAGHPQYRLAYQAPPQVQDAVAVFMLEHGGAHNWDPRYGNDPCTIGLP